MKQAEKINALLGDVAFPLMGYFFWNWNFYFILLYFILDQVARTIFLPWRLKLTELNQSEKIKIIVKNVHFKLQNKNNCLFGRKSWMVTKKKKKNK